MDPCEASELRSLFGKLAPREQGLCLGVLLRSRHPHLFERARSPQEASRVSYWYRVGLREDCSSMPSKMQCWLKIDGLQLLMLSLSLSGHHLASKPVLS